jgi:hypothetical protein
MSKPDADWIESGTPWDDFIAFARLNGYPEDELEAILRSHRSRNPTAALEKHALVHRLSPFLG